MGHIPRRRFSPPCECVVPDEPVVAVLAYEIQLEGVDVLLFTILIGRAALQQVVLPPHLSVLPAAPPRAGASSPWSLD